MIIKTRTDSIQKSISLRKSRFSFSEIKLIKSEPKRFFVSITIPGFLYSFESTLTKSQLYRYILSRLTHYNGGEK